LETFVKREHPENQHGNKPDILVYNSEKFQKPLLLRLEDMKLLLPLYKAGAVVVER